jgi:hypothetical protein
VQAVGLRKPPSYGLVLVSLALFLDALTFDVVARLSTVCNDLRVTDAECPVNHSDEKSPPAANSIPLRQFWSQTNLVDNAIPQ